MSYLPDWVARREHGAAATSQQHFSASMAEKLALEACLQGHQGCVNRLAWNEDGSLLASASDDCQVLLWRYPDHQALPLVLETEHHANLFGVKFLPHTGNTRLVTGAMDYTVQLHELEAAPLSHSPQYSSRVWPGRPAAARRAAAAPVLQSQRVAARHSVYNCHTSRVKEVEVAPGEPHLFWSAAEDGQVRQYDTRCGNQKTMASPNALINLPLGPQRAPTQAKSIDINPAAPHLLAVGASDPYVRIFDRRSLGPTTAEAARAAQPVLMLAPPHLSLGSAPHTHITHVNFSSRGDRLVANYHGDHAYCFNVTSSGALVSTLAHHAGLQQQLQGGPPSVALAAGAAAAAGERCSVSRGHQQRLAAVNGVTGSAAGDIDRHMSGSSDSGPSTVNRQLPPDADRARVEGNTALFDQQYSTAIRSFTRAICLAPWSAGLYNQRATALLKRGWKGDAALALLDCDAAVLLAEKGSQPGEQCWNPGAARGARLKRIDAFQALKQYRCALAACEDYQRRHPAHAQDVDKQLQEATASLRERRQQRARRRRRQLDDGLATVRRQQLREQLQQQQQQQGEPGDDSDLLPWVQPDERSRDQTEPLLSADSLGAAAAAPAGAEVAAAEGSSAAADGTAAAGAAAAASHGAVAGTSSPMQLDTGQLSEAFVGPLLPSGATAAPGVLPAESTPAGRASASAAASAAAAEERAAPPSSGPVTPGPSPADRLHTRQQQPQQQGVQDSPGRQGGLDQGQRSGSCTVRKGRGRLDSGDWSSDSSDEEELWEHYRQGCFLQPGQDPAPTNGTTANLSSAGIGSHKQQLWERAVRRQPNTCAAHGATAWWGSSEGGRRLATRYVGHCNVQTDIKEAVFVGHKDQLVACGSDCGHVFVYEADSGALVKLLAADDDVANCVQPHPVQAVLATSGIETAVKLWSPTAAAESRLDADLVKDNMQRISGGGRLVRLMPDFLLQAALQQRPELYELLLGSRLQQRTGTGSQEEDGGTDQGSDDEEGLQEVTCATQ